jgi:hypothetical protein
LHLEWLKNHRRLTSLSRLSARSVEFLVFLLRFQMMICLVGVSPFSSHYVGAILVNAVGGSNIFELAVFNWWFKNGEST